MPLYATEQLEKREFYLCDLGSDVAAFAPVRVMVLRPIEKMLPRS